MQVYKRPICIGKKKKNVPFTLPEKPITCFLGGRKSACKQTRISLGFFGKWCTCTTSLCLRSTSQAAGDSPEGHVPHDQKPEEYQREGSERLHWQKEKEKPGEFQRTALWRWVFRFRFFAAFRGNKKPECEKNSGFFMPV